jgi:DNA-binding NtrC family response regulator
MGTGMGTSYETSPQPEIAESRIILLAVGRDSVLLDSRSRLLRSDGYTVVNAFSGQQALALFLAGDFDAVVLCHSIPARERQTLAQAFHDHSPSTPVVLISTGFTSHDSIVDATLDNEPKHLLGELPKILHKQPGGYHPERRK